MNKDELYTIFIVLCFFTLVAIILLLNSNFTINLSKNNEDNKEDNKLFDNIMPELN